MSEYINGKDANGKVITMEVKELERMLFAAGLQVYGMSLPAIAELRRQYLLKGGAMVITKESILATFEA